MEGVSYAEEKAMNILDRFEQILESDPLIDEIGFVHPSQFLTLEKEVCIADGSDWSRRPLEDWESSSIMNAGFWNKDHKLGISTEVLLPLYKAAKNAFLAAYCKYKSRREYEGNSISGIEISSDHVLESEVMRHSRSLLLLSCDFGTSWNSRKLILSRQHQLSVFVDELLLSGLVLSFSPKSEQAWSHRRWILKMIAAKFSCLEEIVRKESELVEKIAERSKMNYRAWNHRCWLVSYMTEEQVKYELKKSKDWAGLNVADSSCFHYRRRLMLKFLEYLNKKAHKSLDTNVQAFQVREPLYDDAWWEELDWNKQLIERYLGREALWLHRRFLSLCWMRHLIGGSKDRAVLKFIDEETDFVNSCTKITNNEFNDFEAQALHATTYILWITKQAPNFMSSIIREKLGESLKHSLSITSSDRPMLWNLLHAILNDS